MQDRISGRMRLAEVNCVQRLVTREPEDEKVAAVQRTTMNASDVSDRLEDPIGIQVEQPCRPETASQLTFCPTLSETGALASLALRLETVLSGAVLSVLDFGTILAFISDSVRN